VWLIGAMVCLLAASSVQLSVSAGNGWPHNALRHMHNWLMPISCHFRDCKALLVTSLTHVSGAIASVQTFTFTCSLQQRTTYTRNYKVKFLSHRVSTNPTKQIFSRFPRTHFNKISVVIIWFQLAVYYMTLILFTQHKS